ncbi:AfsR/SARP family transcriptional regulator [Actinacidiphila alni]|uniref:AfsR/SARP family transcriptional regulator n=1 Tax=Actinacidiphila alni TaxID=380248 RepID=UPI003F507CD6
MDDGRLRVETLGPLRAYAADREIALGPPKQRAVFAMLALRDGREVSRDRLVDGIWGEAAPTTAVGSLHTYVSGLRRALAGLGEPLVSSGTGYALRLPPGGLDVAEVERLAARARADAAAGDREAALAAFDAALAQWRPGPDGTAGTVLGGLPGAFAAEHRTWAAGLRLRLVREHAELLLDAGRPAAAADRLRAHAAAHPYDEGLRALLITALSRSGRTADALTQYHDLRTRLADDLGLDPSAELRALFASLLSAGAEHPREAEHRREADRPREAGRPQDADPESAPAAAPAAPVRPAQLPRGVPDFVGREDAVRQVLETARAAGSGTDGDTDGHADDGSPRIVMAVGVGGVGKTALAVRCAHLLAPAYPDGQVYVNLRGFDPKRPARSPADALHHLLTSAHPGAVPADHEQRVALWRSIVRDKRMLIVLDNAESADQVEDLLPGDGPSFVIVTSRNRLSGLAVRYGARRVTLSPLTADESLAMLRAAIGDSRVGAELPAARRIAELCDRLPLALRIASEQVTAGSQARIADLAAELEDVRYRLDALQIPDDELYSVRGVLSWSYARLDDRTAHAFRTLGLFPGVNIRAEAAIALLDVPPQAATAALRNLAAQHLMEATGTGYWMHDLTRIYAEEVARDGEPPQVRKAALRRVLHWYVRTLTQDYKSTKVKLPFTLEEPAPHAPLRFADQKELVAWCVQEWDNLAPLLRTAQRVGCHDEAWQLAYLLFDYFYAAGQTRDWVEVLRLGMRSAEMTGDRQAQAVLLNHLGVAYSRLGDNDAAVRELRRGLRLLEDLGDDVLRTSLLGNLASVLREAKDYRAALPYAGQALDLARRSGLDYYEAGVLDVLCELHAELGEFEDALWYGTYGLTAARRCGNVLLEANILLNLGGAEHGLAHAEKASRYFQDALALCESGGDHYHEALTLFGLAKVARAGSDVPAARGLATRALRRLKALGAEETADVTLFLRSLDEDGADGTRQQAPRERPVRGRALPEQAVPARVTAGPRRSGPYRPADPVAR